MYDKLQVVQVSETQSNGATDSLQALASTLFPGCTNASWSEAIAYAKMDSVAFIVPCNADEILLRHEGTGVSIKEVQCFSSSDYRGQQSSLRHRIRTGPFALILFSAVWRNPILRPSNSLACIPRGESHSSWEDFHMFSYMKSSTNRISHC
jgi:hypothetical protein